MPNWCHNTLTVTGEEDDLTAFILAVRPNEERLRREWDDGAEAREFFEKERPEDVENPDPTTFEEFLAKVLQNQPLSFESITPTPESEGDDKSNGIFPDWYAWRLENWGTKWDASFSGPFMGLMASDEADLDATVEAQGVTLTPTVAVYKFDTAWGPPVPVTAAMAEMFPALKFSLRFGEPGGGFAGQVDFEGGELTEEAELQIEDVLAPEEMWF